MRTTISVDDGLLRSAKRAARRLGVTLGEFISEALRRELARPRDPGQAVEIPIFTGGSGMHPGVDGASNRSLQEALERGLASDKLK